MLPLPAPPARSNKSIALSLAAAAALAVVLVSGAGATTMQDCVKAEIILWGDGRHDDTLALNAWLEGKDAVWAADGAPVGAAIVGHSFRLSAAIYVAGGTRRSLEDFRLLWPERGETVAGGTIRSGDDPNAAPFVSGVAITGGDSGEGKPFESPDPAPTARDDKASCATS